ncbi:MAG: FecR domain-containing protein, partial [Sulfuricella sp.]|nr:FecR domain-containing protein [Sulfuricella sp.]
AGARLPAGTALKTGTAANLTLRFVDGSRLLVMGDSSLTLTRLMLYGKTGMAHTAVHLDGGAVSTEVAPQNGAAARYQIESQALNLGVRGTDFRVSVAADGLTHGEVLKGRVLVSGGNAQVAVDGGFGTLAAVGAAPRAPVPLLAAPQLGSAPPRLERLPVRFAWPATSGAKAYRVRLYRDPPGFEQLVEDRVSSEPQAKWAELGDGEYRLRVRAIDADGLEGFDGELSFTLKARPEPPYVIAPQDGKLSHGEAAVLRWAQPANAARYHVQLGSGDFAQPLAEQASLAGGEMRVPLAPGRYSWRVASITPGGDHGPFSDAQVFEQRATPQAPGESAQDAEGKAEFRWKAGEAGQSFEAQVSPSADFQDIAASVTVAEPLVRFPDLAPGVWFLRVRTLDSDGFAGPFGAPQQFSVRDDTRAGWLLLLVPILLSL